MLIDTMSKGIAPRAIIMVLINALGVGGKTNTLAERLRYRQMNTLLVGYDLDRPAQNYTNLEAA